jgi:glycosyltransferase involved in cell wall biosynthesis
MIKPSLHVKLFILLLFIIIVIYSYVRKYTLLTHEYMTNMTNNIPDFKDNIVNVYDNKGNKINVAFVVAPMSVSDKKNYDTYHDKMVFLGMTSYLEFPNIISNPLDAYHDPNHTSWKFDYKNKLQGWLYCFKNPQNYFPPHIPKALISESDFVDVNLLQPSHTVKKKYDFIYICHKYDAKEKKCTNDWVTYNKNWKLATECLYIMCHTFKLKGLLVGRMGCDIPPVCMKHIDMTEKIPWNEMKQKYQESKFLFVPNIYDASPRVITEAMSINLPVLLNKNILGGWKYINKQTGELFNNIDDFSSQLQKIISNNATYTPRKYILDNYGIVPSGKRLLEFIKKHYNQTLQLSPDIQYITPRFNKKNYETSKQ